MAGCEDLSENIMLTPLWAALSSFLPQELDLSFSENVVFFLNL